MPEGVRKAEGMIVFNSYSFLRILNIMCLIDYCCSHYEIICHFSQNILL